MLNQQERREIELMALEQALRAAALAKADPLPLIPLVTETVWPFLLTQEDADFLRIQGISLA